MIMTPGAGVHAKFSQHEQNSTFYASGCGYLCICVYMGGGEKRGAGERGEGETGEGGGGGETGEGGDEWRERGGMGEKGGDTAHIKGVTSK